MGNADQGHQSLMKFLMFNDDVQSESTMMPSLRPVRKKSFLRREMRNKRNTLAPARQSAASAGLLDQLRSIISFNSARTIAMYLVNDGEIDPARVMQWCWENAKIPTVPVVQGDSGILVFAEVTPKTRFRENRFGIREPVITQTRVVTARQLDLVLLPLVAFDQVGNRLGMGGGFYDRTFEFLANTDTTRPELIGIAHEIQKVKQIHVEPWDIPLTTVVTDKQVYSFPIPSSASVIN